MREKKVMNAERRLRPQLFLLVVTGDIVIETRMPYYVSRCESVNKSANVYIIYADRAEEYMYKTLYIGSRVVGWLQGSLEAQQQLIAGCRCPAPRKAKGRDGRPAPLMRCLVFFRHLFPSTTHLFRAVNSQKRGADTSFFRLKDPPQKAAKQQCCKCGHSQKEAPQKIKTRKNPPIVTRPLHDSRTCN